MKNKDSKINSAIEFASDWLINSGIQNRGGGFGSWFDPKKHDYPFIYPEITGYGITSLLYLNSVKRNFLIKRAELAANWLIKNTLHEIGGIRVRGGKKKIKASRFIAKDLLYAFDSGVVLFGFISLFKYTKKKKYLNIAKKIGNYLVGTQKPDGSFCAIFNEKTMNFIDSSEKWSTQSGSFHAKLALGLLELWKNTKITKYKNSAIRICRFAMRNQMKNGRFVTSRFDKSTHAHPHCYSAEGLLYSGITLKNKSFINAALSATKWLLNNQLRKGGIPSKFIKGRFVKYERSDVLAQTLRLGLILISIDMLPKHYKKNIDFLKQRLISFQCLKIDKKSKGGFFYGFELDGKKHLDVNSWCTMFALQALLMTKQYEENNQKVKMEFFV